MANGPGRICYRFDMTSPRAYLAFLAMLLTACGTEEPAESSEPTPELEACRPELFTPNDAEFVRIDGAHATDDPIKDRLCVEGAKPPAELANPWDLHCDVASGLGAKVDDDSAAPERLRILEWNIKFGTDLDGVIDVLENDSIAKDADVLLLVEVDRGCDRSNQVDVARTLAERWGMDWAFGVEFVEHSQGGCEEGNAILSRYPLGNVTHAFHNVGGIERGKLRAPYDWAEDEDEPRTGRRSFLSGDIPFADGLFRVVSSHLENRSSAEERGAQIGEIVDSMNAAKRRAGCAAGDLNVFPDIGTTIIDLPLFDLMSEQCFTNPHADMEQIERRTRPSLNYQIDFTFLRTVRSIQIVDRGVLNDIADVPSDHYPVWVDIRYEQR